MKFIKDRSEARADIFMNLLIWITVFVGLLIVSTVAHLFDPDCNIRVPIEFLHFVDIKIWVAQVIGGSLAIGIISIARTLLTDRESAPVQKRLLDEFFAVFRNFGSIFLIASAIFFIAWCHDKDATTSALEFAAFWKNGCAGLVNVVCSAARKNPLHPYRQPDSTAQEGNP